MRVIEIPRHLKGNITLKCGQKHHPNHTQSRTKELVMDTDVARRWSTTRVRDCSNLNALRSAALPLARYGACMALAPSSNLPPKREPIYSNTHNLPVKPLDLLVAPTPKISQNPSKLMMSPRNATSDPKLNKTKSTSNILKLTRVYKR